MRLALCDTDAVMSTEGDPSRPESDTAAMPGVHFMRAANLEESACDRILCSQVTSYSTLRSKCLEPTTPGDVGLHHKLPAA